MSPGIFDLRTKRMERKTFEAKLIEKRENGGRIIISTRSPDRDRDRVFPEGGVTQNYLNNPVVQWGHNYHDPWATVGRSNSIELGGDGIVADFELRPAANEQDPQNIVKLLWEGGWVRTASIGFNPIEWKDNEFGGRDFTKWELLEWSIVPIPANQDALALAVKGLTAEATKAERDPAATVAVNDTADEPEPVQEDAPVAEVAEDATPTEADDLTAEDEAALEELLANIADVLASVILED